MYGKSYGDLCGGLPKSNEIFHTITFENFRKSRFRAENLKSAMDT